MAYKRSNSDVDPSTCELGLCYKMKTGSELLSLWYPVALTVKQSATLSSLFSGASNQGSYVVRSAIHDFAGRCGMKSTLATVGPCALSARTLSR
jgi:hypothetical protein